MKKLQLVEMKYFGKENEELILPIDGSIRHVTYQNHNRDLDGGTLRFHLEVDANPEYETQMKLLVVRTGDSADLGNAYYWASVITDTGLIHIYEIYER